MREIEFRGQQIKAHGLTNAGDWVYGGYCVDPFTGAKYIVVWNSTGLGYMDLIEVDPATVGQYTGLTDRNGKRIFEGDALDCGDRIVMVRWHDQVGCWDSDWMAYKGKLKSNGIAAVDWKYRAEIIGNIHDQEVPNA